MIAVSETLNRLDPLSVIFKRFPAVPPEPMLMLNKSPVAVAEVGDQSKESNRPVVSAAEVEEMLAPYPVVKTSAAIVIPLAVVISVSIFRATAFPFWSINIPLPVPAFVIFKAEPVLRAPELVKDKTEPVLAALDPERVRSAKFPVKAVEVEAMERAVPEVRAFPSIL